jgi:hypothetical protein
MSAGLPGLGLGGLFFLLSALVAPVVELARTIRGESSAAAWRGVGRQFAIAVTMIVAVDLALRMVLLLTALAGASDTPPDPGLTVLPLAPIGITMGLLVAVLAAAKALQLALRVRDHGLPRLAMAGTGPAARRLVPGGGIVAGAWFALLLFGATQLSPIYGQRGGSSAPDVVAGMEDHRTLGPDRHPAPAAAALSSGAVNPSGDAGRRAAKPAESLFSSRDSSGDQPRGSRAPAGNPGDPAATLKPPDASEVAEPAMAPPQSDPPASEVTPAQSAPPAATGPPDGAEPPDGAGPPAEAGPPPQAGAPPGSGPPPWAGPPARS